VSGAWHQHRARPFGRMAMPFSPNPSISSVSVTEEGGEFDDELGDEDHARPLLPPDDRLWRHPTEVAASFQRHRSSAPWSSILVGGLVVALVATGIATTTLGRHSSGARGAGQTALEQTVADTVRGASGPPDGTVPVTVTTGVLGIVHKVAPALVAVEGRTRTGSVVGTGVVFRSDGMIMTASRVVQGTVAVTVVTASGLRRPAQVVGLDPDSAIAVLRVEASLPTAPVGSSSRLSPGELTLAVASTDRPDRRPTIAIGVIEAVHQTVKLDGRRTLVDAIETDAWAAAPGAALLDQSGRVVGIDQAVPGGHFAVATPIDVAERAAEQLAMTGHVVRAWLGIEGVDLTAARPGTPSAPQGALVDEVAPGSPAALAGLRPGDVIVALDGQPVRSMGDLLRVLSLMQPGTAVVLTVVRDGQASLLRAVLGRNTA
jgi:S1-C subfamily serine protease